MLKTKRQRIAMSCLLLSVWVLLACVCTAPTGFQITTTDMSRHRPAWACPSDTPKPYEADGPIRYEGCCCEEECKDTDGDGVDDDCDCVDDEGCYECRYYKWEQEYGVLGGPPFPGPTSYTITNDTQFRMNDHLVNFAGGVDTVLSVRAGERYSQDPETGRWSIDPEGPQQIQVVTVVFQSTNPMPMPLDPGRQVVITQIVQPDGRSRHGTWKWDRSASEASGIWFTTVPLTSTELADMVGSIDPTGSITATEDYDDILSTEDTSWVVTGSHQMADSYTSVMQVEIVSGTTMLEVPIFTPPASSVTVADMQMDPPDAARQTEAGGGFRVSFINDPEPFCKYQGIPQWSPGGRVAVSGPEAASPNSDVAQTALQGVGHQYCWGGTGYTPCSGLDPVSGVRRTPPCPSLPCWDCSGLMQWAYRQHGIEIPRTTTYQKTLPAVSISEIQPGDLLLFPGHVGMYVGDVDGDGTGDMVHAGWPDSYGDGVGIGIERNVLEPGGSWRRKLTVITRPPRQTW